MTNYRKLENQPLVLTLAEFRFSPVLDIQSYIPAFQEKIRRHYPLTAIASEPVIQIIGPNIDVAMKNSWQFVAADRQSVVTLDQERLVYVTTDYDRFDGFAESCRDVLEPLIAVVEPALVLRIGLRYCDLIRIDDGEAVEDYVDACFGFPKLTQSLGTPEQQRDEIAIRTETGQLVIRSLYGFNNLTCSPDLQGIPILPKPDTDSSQRILLDFDHMWNQGDTPVPFRLDDIGGLLGGLHETARAAFWQVTTDKAKETKWTS